ncbi:hypothetical protein [Rhodanobacter sp. C03]|uniref:hypothetical protein n=1 Tax=Rhodanobacter sp. C03 TaxID=1945858 RepID=UPI00143A0C2D|nr:hypothetical protein [Rhodanobacter sp. C03]
MMTLKNCWPELANHFDIDHTEDILEMVCHVFAAGLAGQPRTFDHGQEVPVLGVFQHLGQLTGLPVFIAIIQMTDAVKGGLMLVADVLSGHGASPCVLTACARMRCGKPSISASCATTA